MDERIGARQHKEPFLADAFRRLTLMPVIAASAALPPAASAALFTRPCRSCPLPPGRPGRAQGQIAAHCSGAPLIFDTVYLHFFQEARDFITALPQNTTSQVS